MRHRVRFIGMEQPARLGYQDIAPACAVYEVTRDDGSTFEMRQPCAVGPGYYTAARQPVWGWNGDMERPTLTPSFLCQLENGTRLHWFLTGGRIQPCGDNGAEVL